MRLRERVTGDSPLSADLIDWEVAQADPYGDVWLAAVIGDDWALYPPGVYDAAGNDPLAKVAPAYVRFNEVGRWRRPRLRRVRRWLVPWVELVSGARVVDTVEGLAWYGPEYDQSRHVIYLRVAAPPDPPLV